MLIEGQFSVDCDDFNWSKVWVKGIDRHSTRDVFSAHDPMTEADIEMTKNNQLAST